MKKYLLFIICLMLLKCAGAQVSWPGSSVGTTKTLADTTVFYSARIDGRGNEVIIRNRTKDTLGLLTNIGQGLTSFKRSKLYLDSFLIIGNDTILIHNHIDTSGGIPFEVDPVWYRASVPGRASLDTAYLGNPEVVVRDSIGGGLFHIYDSTGLKVDSGIVFKTQDPTKYRVRDRSQAVGRNVRWYGAVGDGVHDDRAAIIRAIRSVPRNQDQGGAQANAPTPADLIYFPRGQYYCSDSIHVNRVCRFVGDGGPQGSISTILFAPNKSGFVVMQLNSFDKDSLGNTIDYGGSRAANGTIFENLQITSLSPADSSRGIGIDWRVAAQMHNVVVNNFGYQNVAINCSAGIDATLLYKLSKIYVSYGGAKYQTAPSVVLTPANGATATAILGGQIGHITVTDPGRMYKEQPFVKIQELGDITSQVMLQKGYGASAIAIMGLNHVRVLNGGSGYNPATTTISITVVDGLGGHGAQAHPVIVGGSIVGVIIDSAGESYETTVSMHADVIGGGGTGAILDVDGLQVARIAITSRGHWYEQADPPFIYIRGGRRNTGTIAHAILDSLMNFSVKRVQVVTRGTDNFKLPDVDFVGGGYTSKAVGWAARYTDENGNGNRWRITNCRFLNGGIGLHVVGSDANAGVADGFDCSDNRNQGLWDDSFLGNTYVAGHTSNNLFPYMTTQSVAKNFLLNCYSEGNQEPSVIALSTFSDRGDMGAGITGPGTWTDKEGAYVQKGGKLGAMTAAAFGDPDEGVILDIRNSNMDETGSFKMKLDPQTSDMYIEHYDFSPLRTLMWTGPYTSERFGRTDTLPYVQWSPGIELGTTTLNSRMITRTTGFPPLKYSPTQKGWARGDLSFSTFPIITSADSTITLGWIRALPGNTDTLGKDWYPLRVSVKQSSTNTTDQTFANTDLTATANRLHHFKGFSLTIDSLAYFRTNSKAIASGREYLYRGFVTDAGNEQVFFANSTSGDNQFNPTFGGHTERTNAAISFTHYIFPAQDKDTIVGGIHNPLIRMSAFTTTSGADPLNGTLAVPINRRLFAVNVGGAGTGGVDVFTIDHDGAIISSRYKNNIAEDSMLTTDVNGRFKMRSFSSFDSGGGTTLSGVQGDIIYFSATNTVANLAKSVTATRYLSNTGTSNNPIWAQINLSNGVNNILPMSSGGTGNGAMSTAAGGIFYTDGTKFARLAAGTSGQVLVTHGAGFAPSWMTMSTGTGGDCDETDPLSIYNQSTLQSTANFNIDGNGSLTELEVKAGGAIRMNSADNSNQSEIIADDIGSSQTFRLPSVSNGYFIIGYMSRQFLDFPTTLSGSHSSITITMTGADSEDGATVGCDDPANWPDGSYYTAHGIGAGLVRITFFNFTGTTVDPVGEFYNVRDIK